MTSAVAAREEMIFSSENDQSDRTFDRVRVKFYAAIVEESGLGPVELHWVAPGKVEQVSPMSGEAQASYLGALGPFDTPGAVRWWVSALDIRNNRAESPPQILRVGSC